MILYSQAITTELRKKYSKTEIDEMFDHFMRKGVMQEVKVTAEQLQEARRIAAQRAIPFGDAIHAILARDNWAIVLARDHHFRELTDITETRKPEELL